MAKYICSICGCVYDTETGLENGLYAGVAFDDLPENFLCPICSEPKEYFEELSAYNSKEENK